MNSSASDAGAGRNDAALVAACRAGERQAFVEIVQRHQSLVCAVAYNVTGRFAASEEVAQDTFVTAWRKNGRSARTRPFARLADAHRARAGGRLGKAAAELVTGPQREQVPLSFVLNLAYNQAQRDPEAAMQWANQLAPACQAQARLRVLDAWTSNRPEAAAAWVLQQPAGEARQDLIASTTRHLLSASSEETARQFFAQLPAAERALAREVVSETLDSAKKQSLLRALADP